MRPPCATCNLPLLPGEPRCPKCAGAHWKLAPGTIILKTLVAPPAPKPAPQVEPARRRGKPVGKWGKLTDDQLLVLHRIHTERNLSMRGLARQIWQKAGYASEGACAEGIRTGWSRLDLPARPRALAAAQANVARRAPDSPGTADRAAYKRWLRATGRTQ